MHARSALAAQAPPAWLQIIGRLGAAKSPLVEGVGMCPIVATPGGVWARSPGDRTW